MRSHDLNNAINSDSKKWRGTIRAIFILSGEITLAPSRQRRLSRRGWQHGDLGAIRCSFRPTAALPYGKDNKGQTTVS